MSNVRCGGKVSGIDVGTRGTYFFDEFESRRLTYIGAADTALAATLDADSEEEAFGVGDIIEVYIPDEYEDIDVDVHAALPENGLYLPVIGN